MKHLSKRIFRALEKDLERIPEEIDLEIPDYTQISDHKQSKEVMKSYLEKTMESAREHAGKETYKAIQEAEEILSDENFILQKGVRSLSDKDARVGYKSKTSSFFGYKTEFIMTTDERIITAIHGMARARGWGLKSMELQIKFTAIAVNLKRIAALYTKRHKKISESNFLCLFYMILAL